MKKLPVDVLVFIILRDHLKSSRGWRGGLEIRNPDVVQSTINIINIRKYALNYSPCFILKKSACSSFLFACGD